MADIAGQGDITNPGAWEDSSGNIPPLAYQNVPQTVNYPLNGDGRYWFTPSASSPTPDPIFFIGDTGYITPVPADNITLQCTITQAARDGSELHIQYTTDAGTIDVQLGPSLQGNSLLSKAVVIDMSLGTGSLSVAVVAVGGTPDSFDPADAWNVAVAITRNNNEAIAWDYPNPFDPISYNCECMDDVVPTATLLTLRTRMMRRLGYSSQALNIPVAMAALIDDFLSSAQTFLYRRYLQLHTKRLFRWKVNPGQRFYSLKDNDEDVLCNFRMDPMKDIEWAGIQDSRNVWYPLIEGIPPQLYTMIDKPWRPARYEIRQCIELYPAPDQTYWLWLKGHFGLRAFAADEDQTTLDCELVFLHALANAKSHYGQPDANNVEAQANAYRKQLIAGTHGTTKYVPGTIAIPPSVRPTLIQFDGNQGA
jgi:hypothetical protein